MSKELIETLREHADKAEAGDKSHWALAMRQAAEYIRADLKKPLLEPLTDEQIHDLWDITNGNLHKFTRAIEAAHGIKEQE